MLRILENDLLLKHDAVWPRGLNHTLRIESPLDLAELRRSCVRHRWPPEAEREGALREAPGGAGGPRTPLDLIRLRALMAASPAGRMGYSGVGALKEAAGSEFLNRVFVYFNQSNYLMTLLKEKKLIIDLG